MKKKGLFLAGVIVVIIAIGMGRCSKVMDGKTVKRDKEYIYYDEKSATASNYINKRPETISSEEYILPDSNKKEYTAEELTYLPENQYQIAINEIYARHGRKFKADDKGLQTWGYFSTQSWYQGDIEPEDFDESVLNKYESANINLLESLWNHEAGVFPATLLASAENPVTNYEEYDKQAEMLNGDDMYIMDGRTDFSGGLYKLSITCTDKPMISEREDRIQYYNAQYSVSQGVEYTGFYDMRADQSIQLVPGDNADVYFTRVGYGGRAINGIKAIHITNDEESHLKLPVGSKEKNEEYLELTNAAFLQNIIRNQDSYTKIRFKVDNFFNIGNYGLCPYSSDLDLGEKEYDYNNKRKIYAYSTGDNTDHIVDGGSYIIYGRLAESAGEDIMVMIDFMAPVLSD